MVGENNMLFNTFSDFIFIGVSQSNVIIRKSQNILITHNRRVET